MITLLNKTMAYFGHGFAVWIASRGVARKYKCVGIGFRRDKPYPASLHLEVARLTYKQFRIGDCFDSRGKCHRQCHHMTKAVRPPANIPDDIVFMQGKVFDGSYIWMQKDQLS